MRNSRNRESQNTNTYVSTEATNGFFFCYHRVLHGGCRVNTHNFKINQHEKHNIFKSLTMRKHDFARRIFGRALPCRDLYAFIYLSIIPKLNLYERDVW